MGEGILTMPLLLTEAEAYEVYGNFLQDKELRRARERRLIGYYRRKNKILYRADELAAFVETRLQRSYVPPCQNSSASESIGSPELEAQPNSIASGMTPELEKSAADRLRLTTSRKPRSDLQPSSSEKAKLRLVTQET